MRNRVVSNDGRVASQELLKAPWQEARRVSHRSFGLGGLFAAALCVASCGGGSGGGLTGVQATTLEVVPPTGLACFEENGSLAGIQETYVLSNTSGTNLTWSASVTQPWLFVDRSGGVLSPGDEVHVTVSVDQVAAATLPQGLHSDTIMIVNETDGAGTTERHVELGVGTTDQALLTSPQHGLMSMGSDGGSFAPQSIAYSLINATGSPVTWAAVVDEEWVLLSAEGGHIETGERAMLVVAIDPEKAGALGVGDLTAKVEIRNVTNGAGSTQRSVDLEIMGDGVPLALTPDDGLVSSGGAGGPFSPASFTYTLTNTGSKTLPWAARSSAEWATLSRREGQIAPGGKTMVNVVIDPVVAGGLTPGTYSGNVDFINADDDSNIHSRPVDLIVTGSGAELLTTPLQGLVSDGPLGGPFAPAQQAYRLQNTGENPVSWTASASKSWVALSTESGLLSAGAEALLTASIDQSVAGQLPIGTHSAMIDIIDATSGSGTTSRKVTLTVEGNTGGSQAASVSQFGITWSFDQAYEVGQFVNGDWWVVGPVTIVAINPPSTAIGGRTQHGSMVNPVPSLYGQGYDSAMFAQYRGPGSYSALANVALDVSFSNPLDLAAHSSLISTISIDEDGARPQLQAAAILTVLDSPAAPGSFRPAYCGSDKTIEFHEGQLDYSELRSLTPVTSTPELHHVESWFERPWIDHIQDWVGRYHHPSENMPDYGREICDQVSTASLMLQLDFTNSEKRLLLIRLVQLGIDFNGIVENGGANNWPAGGGHHSGRKWPILFAGLLLDDPDMRDIGFNDEVAFNEDDQTFYVQETAPGVFNHGFGGYGPQDVGLPEWGNQHAKNLGQDDSTWFGNPYRTCCTANVWWGEILAARMMGARALWNHDALFDYQDRYRSVAPTTGQVSWTITWSGFQLDMWDAYRSSF